MLLHDMIAVTAETDTAIQPIGLLLKPQLIDERIILGQVAGHNENNLSNKNERRFGNVLS